MSDDKPQRSMRDFDFFADDAQPTRVEALADEQELPPGLEEQLLLSRRALRRRSRLLLLASVALALSVWFLWGYRDWMVYAFSPPRPPLELGDVTRLTPAQIPVNAFVSVTGITEHRGLTQKMVRGLSLDRRELWYFRLLGSRGVFIEVEPDSKRWGFTTEVSVSGRAVDPRADGTYRELLNAYNTRYASEQRPELRIVQVGIRPGEHRWPYALAISVVGAVMLANVWMLLRTARARREVRRRGGLRS